MPTKYKILLIVTTTIVALDQSIKHWVRDRIPVGGRPIEILPGLFQIVHAENRGAAWGLLRNFEHRLPLLLTATVLAFVLIAWYLHKMTKGQEVLALAMSLILGGAIGNFIDRVIYHSVTDYLDFYISYQPVKAWLRSVFRSNHWPSFNLADVAIVAGLLLVMFDMLWLERRRLVEVDDDSDMDDMPGMTQGREAAQ